jgi:hypothetical protein
VSLLVSEFVAAYEHNALIGTNCTAVEIGNSITKELCAGSLDSPPTLHAAIRTIENLTDEFFPIAPRCPVYQHGFQNHG